MAFIDPVPDGSGCDHYFGLEREVPKEDLPPFIKGPVMERYCSKCGIKQDLRHRLSMAMEATAPPVDDFKPPPLPRHASQEDLPDPIPVEDIVIELDVEHYGKRYDNNRQRGVRDKAIGIVGDLRLHEALSAAAEEFVAKALGLPYAGDVSGPDKGYDLVMHGIRIQVKWTKNHSNRLISSPKQLNVADYYVLVTGPLPSDFKIRGWARLAELKASITDLGYGPTYSLNQDQLHPFEDLLALRLGQSQD